MFQDKSIDKKKNQFTSMYFYACVKHETSGYKSLINNCLWVKKRNNYQMVVCCNLLFFLHFQVGLWYFHFTESEKLDVHQNLFHFDSAYDMAKDIFHF
ncbi:hypothetical protein C1637_05630 [Chryseobacterium lactis]|uniref:Uncharacterized protein n=1 Tax=Chryseobacterium lactis TaxID=1241981 RepID=A0A3G6RNC9_CHRLC|nr:hypothetical protein EG342_21600 [Chryseobacterium lactis]AZB04709.1 hypothetical protein EG341_12480 [Chryseobacterium lactis]PNW14440.1 hypothetical protein C1637_05630 [Chryseobacterium lactis]